MVRVLSFLGSRSTKAASGNYSLISDFALRCDCRSRLSADLTTAGFPQEARVPNVTIYKDKS